MEARSTGYHISYPLNRQRLASPMHIMLIITTSIAREHQSYTTTTPPFHVSVKTQRFASWSTAVRTDSSDPTSRRYWAWSRPYVLRAAEEDAKRTPHRRKRSRKRCWPDPAGMDRRADERDWRYVVFAPAVADNSSPRNSAGGGSSPPAASTAATVVAHYCSCVPAAALVRIGASAARFLYRFRVAAAGPGVLPLPASF